MKCAIVRPYLRHLSLWRGVVKGAEGHDTGIRPALSVVTCNENYRSGKASKVNHTPQSPNFEGLRRM